jgi:hypothetical protein
MYKWGLLCEVLPLMGCVVVRIDQTEADGGASSVWLCCLCACCVIWLSGGGWSWVFAVALFGVVELLPLVCVLVV